MRLFIALDLPEAVTTELVGWQQSVVAGKNGLRIVSRDSLHVTLAFLGEVEPSRIDAVSGAVDALAGTGAAPLALGAPVWLPRRRPGVLAVAVEDDEHVLRDTQGLLASALRQGVGIEPEGRIFFPHITAARVRRGFKVRPAPLEGPRPLEFLGTRVTLYESVSAYRPLHGIEL